MVVLSRTNQPVRNSIKPTKMVREKNVYGFYELEKAE